MSRFDVLERSQMTPRQQEVADAIASGPRGGLKGPFLALIHNPELANHVQALGEHLRFGTGLDPRLVEIAILVTARSWDCDYEWAAHARLARVAGVPDDLIDTLAQGLTPVNPGSDEALVHAFADETVHHGKPSDATYDEAESRFGKATVLDLLAICGYYTLLAFVLNAAQLPLPPQTAALPARA